MDEEENIRDGADIKKRAEHIHDLIDEIIELNARYNMARVQGYDVEAASIEFEIEKRKQEIMGE